MSLEQFLSNLRNQTDIDDARIDARQKEILTSTEARPRKASSVAASANPDWLNSDSGDQAAQPAKKARQPRKKAAPKPKAAVDGNQRWKEAAESEAERQAED